MKTAEKIFSFLYNVMGWCTWLGVVGILVFMTVLFATGDSRSPDITVDSIAVSAVTENDPVRSQAGIKNTDGLFRIDYNVHIAGASLSPYSYSVNGIKLKTFDGGTNVKYVSFAGNGGAEKNVIKYSKLTPADFTVSVYVQAAGRSTAEIQKLSSSAGFTLTDMQLHFSIFDIDVTSGTPSFYVKDNPDVKITAAA